MKNIVGWVLGAAFLAAPGAAPAGWELVDANGTRTLLQDGRLRSVDRSDSSISFSFDARAGKLTAIYPAEKLYAEADVDEVCEAFDALNRHIAESMPADERRMMEEYLGDQAAAEPPKVEVKALGAETIADLRTEHYQIIVAGEPYREVWLSPKVLGSPEDAEKLMELTRRTAQCTTLGFGRAGPIPEDTKAFQALMRKGWPLRSVHYGRGHEDTGEQKPRVDTETVEVHQREIYEEEFAPPPGFRKVPVLRLLETEMLGVQ